jgi:hypothetical protein
MKETKSDPTVPDNSVQECAERDLVEEFRDLDEHLRKELMDRGLETSLVMLTDLEELLEAIEQELAEVEVNHAAEVQRDPDAVDSVDLAAAGEALKIVCDGLAERGIESPSLKRLFSGLQDLHGGASPAGMFLPSKSRSRRPDPGNIQFAKGSIAAIIHAKQKVGKLGREEAAKWVLKYLSPQLQGRISLQPITRRMLIEWLDRYGGRSGGTSVGRMAFLAYSEAFSKYSDMRPDDCASFSNGLAEKLPALKRAKHRKPLT